MRGVFLADESIPDIHPITGRATFGNRLQIKAACLNQTGQKINRSNKCLTLLSGRDDTWKAENTRHPCAALEGIPLHSAKRLRLSLLPSLGTIVG